MVNTIIKSAIDSIAAKYRGGEMHWLRINNPAALRQLDALQANVDKSALAAAAWEAENGTGAAETNYASLRVAARVWQQSWIFWINTLKGKHAL